MRAYRVCVQVEVEINVDDDVIDRCFTDDWKGDFYNFKDADEVVSHLAFNAVMNGVENISRLDGWGDVSDAGIVANATRVDRNSFEVLEIESL